MALDDLLDLRWYYQIEVEPGRSTPGRPIGTLPTVRRIVDSIDFTGQRVLDIGTQEFAAPILIESKDPEEIVAYDRLSLVDQFDLLKEVYGLSSTTYVHGVPMQELKDTLTAQGITLPFDIVVFTGVLYHMVDPLPGIAMARSMLRNNGLMVLETSVAAREGFVADCNHAASLYKGSNYFQVSPQILDYWCRMLRLRPIDVLWYGGEDIKRMFVILQAETEAIAETEDHWIRKGFVTKDFEPFGLHYHELTSAKDPVPYSPIEGLGQLKYTDTAPSYLDVWGTLSSRSEAKPDLTRAVITLDDRKP